MCPKSVFDAHWHLIPPGEGNCEEPVEWGCGVFGVRLTLIITRPKERLCMPIPLRPVG